MAFSKCFYYNQAIELNPKDFNAFNNRGTAYAKLKQFEKAIQDYNQA
jgi:regulator of sirC expression with transglutaminase-like and TPR domain